VVVPSLDDWEKEWQKNPRRIAQPKLLPVDFQAPRADTVKPDSEMSVAAVARAN
jgi:hypothetical protein